VNDLLDISRLEAGRLEVKQAPVDLGALIGVTLQPLRGLAGEKGLTMTHILQKYPASF
jgi:signal transduction histidine kinase